ncbi:MAG: trehalose-phosphatase, partial [Rhodoferax sp.]|nr:trehalose-phosphatase [Rhodoferax sp.]
MKTLRARFPPPASLDWAYFLDVDGTLINFADTPRAVLVDRTLLDLIAGLHRASGGAVALVSGRMISDLQELIGM